MGVYMIYCGYLHLSGPSGTARLVPSWIPGAMGWTYFTGVALVLGGAGFWLPPVRRLAAGFSSVMIFLWVILLHIPAALKSSGFGSNATTATFEALAFSGLALIVAAVSEPGTMRPTTSLTGSARS
jgi:Ca2+/H+ antiporter